jgi:hypothetical protein
LKCTLDVLYLTFDGCVSEDLSLLGREAFSFWEWFLEGMIMRDEGTVISRKVEYRSPSDRASHLIQRVGCTTEIKLTNKSYTQIRFYIY